jgi:O-antigen/teichoic acid export membrane protein/O-antigen ligase
MPEHNRRDLLLWLLLALLLALVVIACTTGPSPFLTLVLSGALAVAIVAVAQPVVALFLVYLGAAFPALLLPVPGHLLRPVEVGLLLCVLAVVARPARMRLRLPHLLALLFLGIALVSFLHVPTISTDPNTYAADKRLYGWFLLLVALFCGTLLVRYVKNPAGFLAAMLLSNIPIFLVCLLQARNIHLPWWLEVSGASDPRQTMGRLWGPFDWSTTLGLYLINLFAVALSCWLLGIRRYQRILGLVFTLATALAEIGSGSRGATVGIVLMAVLAFLLLRRYTILLATLLLGSAGALIFLNKVLQLFLHPATSATNRLFLWQEALKLIAANPWIGIGLQQFPRYYAQLIVSPAAELNARGIGVHNMFLEWAMEGGIIWLVVGLFLFASMLSVCWKGWRHVQETGQRSIFLAAGLAVLGNLVGGIFEVPTDHVEAAVFLFLLMGLALGYAERTLRARQGRRIPVPSLPLLVSPLALAVAGELPQAASRGVRMSLPAKQRFTRQASPAASGSWESETDDSQPSAHKTGRSVVIQLVSWGIAIPLIFPTTALLTRYLGPLQYGEYTFALPYISIFAYISGIGMDALVIRELSRRKRKTWSEILSYSLGTRLVCTLAGAGIAALGALLLPVGTEERNVLLLGSVSLVFSFSVNGLRMIYSNGFRAEQRVTTLALIEMANRMITAGLVVVVVVLHLSLLWAYALILYSDVPFFILQVWIARRRYHIRIRFSLTEARKHLLTGLPLMGYNVLVLIGSQIDVFFLMALAGMQSVGIYALAMRITDPLLAIVVAYGTGVYPLLCATFAQGRKRFAPLYCEATRILALAIVPLALFVSIEARQIVFLLGGQRFTTAEVAVQLLIWAMAATFFGQLAVRACMAANKERLIPYGTAAAVGVNVLTNLLLIPHWNIVGAGVAAVASEVTGLCLFSFLIRRHVRLLAVLWVMLRVALGCLPALAFLLWQQHGLPLSPLLAGPLAFVCLLAGCMATRTLSLQDLRAIWRMLFARTAHRQPEDISERPTAILPALSNWPTTFLPMEGGDIADYPTLLLPRIEI